MRREYSERKSPRIDRISYPVPGDSGYDDPIGRKHYQLHPSPIHSLIFNQKEQGTQGLRRRQQLSYSLVDESINREPISREPINREPINREPISREPINREPISREPISREPISRVPIYRRKDSLDEMLDEYGSHVQLYRFRNPTYLNSQW